MLEWALISAAKSSITLQGRRLFDQKKSFFVLDSPPKKQGPILVCAICTGFRLWQGVWLVNTSDEL